jgi:hypothetical protein
MQTDATDMKKNARTRKPLKNAPMDTQIPMHEAYDSDSIDLIKTKDDFNIIQSNQNQSISLEELSEKAKSIKIELTAAQLEEVQTRINNRAAVEEINDMDKYAKSSLRNAHKAAIREGYKANAPPNRFVNYKQPEYDFDKLEKLERAYLDQRLKESTG